MTINSSTHTNRAFAPLRRLVESARKSLAPSSAHAQHGHASRAGRSGGSSAPFFSKDTFHSPSGARSVGGSNKSSAASAGGAQRSASFDNAIKNLTSVLKNLVGVLDQLLARGGLNPGQSHGGPQSPSPVPASSPGSSGAPSTPGSSPTESPQSHGGPSSQPQGPSTQPQGPSSQPVPGTPSSPGTTNDPGTSSPSGPVAGPQGSPSTPGAPVGNFPTRHWGGSERQFDKVYQFKGDDSPQPSFGGWAWSKPDTNAIAKAGFNWFEVGYPTTLNKSEFQNLRDKGVRPIAYVNMGEVTPDLAGQVGNVPILKHNGDWNTNVVDVRDQRWQDWLVKRADFAYQQGARGIKWDCAGVERNYSDPAQKQQALDAMGNVLERLRQMHPDMKNVVNQGYALANARPDLVDGVETESLMSARDQGGGMTQWANEELAKLKDIHSKYGIPIFMAEYTDPNSSNAQRWANDIEKLGYTPYITSNHWDVRGRGLNINPNW